MDSFQFVTPPRGRHRNRIERIEMLILELSNIHLASRFTEILRVAKPPTLQLDPPRKGSACGVKAGAECSPLKTSLLITEMRQIPSRPRIATETASREDRVCNFPDSHSRTRHPA